MLAEGRAWMVVMGPQHAEMLGIKVKEYIPAKMTIQVVNNRSTFNVCTHQKLPLVNSSSLLRLYPDPKVRPGNIPLHLQADVRAGLDKDVRLGVLRKVQPDPPVQLFLERTGKVRRTADLKPLNRACPGRPTQCSPHSGQPAGSRQDLEDVPRRQGGLPLHPHPRVDMSDMEDSFTIT